MGNAVPFGIPPRRRKGLRLVVANLAGFVFPVSEGAGKTCKCSIAPPLPGEAYASPGAWTGDEGREFCAEQRDQVTYAGGSNGGQTAPLGREEGSRGTFRKVPRAILWFLSHRGERNAPRRAALPGRNHISFLPMFRKLASGGRISFCPHWFASGGPISLTREKSGKERGGAPPLHPGAAGAEAKGA